MKTNLSESKIANNAVPAAMIDSESSPDVDDRLQRIETAAYYKAEARGFVPGMEIDDWLQAEIEVDAEAQQ